MRTCVVAVANLLTVLIPGLVSPASTALGAPTPLSLVAGTSETAGSREALACLQGQVQPQDGLCPAASQMREPDAGTRAHLQESYGKIPLSFEENRGQTDRRVRFISRGPGHTLFLTKDEAVLRLSAAARGNKRLPGDVTRVTQEERREVVIHTRFIGANRRARVTALDEQLQRSNYLIGSDPRAWRTGVQSYGKVKYEGLYPGIDLVYYGNQRQLEYDLIVAPGADPRKVTFEVNGARRLDIDKDGNLVIETPLGKIVQHRPVVYQTIEGERQVLSGEYVNNGHRRVGFRVAGYNPKLPLVIDPTLAYSTYLGGSGGEWVSSIQVDGSGSVYVGGSTRSSDFPTANPLQAAYGGGGHDAFIAKLSPSGSALAYSTYLGGSGDDYGNNIAVDGSGSVYVAGGTGSSDFPTANPLQAANGGSNDGFVAKLSPSGGTLVYSTYLGGNGDDGASDIAVDGTGSVYLIGSTASSNFPTVNALQGANGGSYDVFAAKLSPSGGTLAYSTYLGGSGWDVANSIAVDGSGSVYLSGGTTSPDFPTMNALQTSYAGGGEDAFLTKLSPSGSSFVYSTYLGGSGYDGTDEIRVDASGNSYIAGYTESTDFPERPRASADE